MKNKFSKVFKFGGSSVGSAERIKNVCKIISEAAKKDRVAVVVSAMQGVTDKLLALDFGWIKEKHLTAAKELKIPAPTDLLIELEKVVKSIKVLGDASPMALDLVASFGERLSANLVAAYLNKKIPAVAVDACALVKTDNNFQNATVDFIKTNSKIRNYFKKVQQLPIITGFIGATDDNKITTLGRGGSDYSASIFGAALGANVIEIWTDADGIMTADPRIVPAARTLPQISYEEAFEMAYFGAKVIHPATMLPAIKKNIPILIKNTFNPKHPGTKIQNSKIKSQNYGIIRNISALDNISLINIGGTNLAGVPGTAERVFKAVADKKVNVILIAQASSEHTICFAVKKSDAEKATAALKKEFQEEMRRGKVFLNKEDDQCIIALVGEQIRGTPGIAGRIFSVLGQKKINISAIAQGGSERNISCVISASQKEEAIQALHREFFENHTPLVFILGTGNVGSELLRQAQSQILNAKCQFKVCGIGDIDKMHFDESGIDLRSWKKVLRQAQDKMNLEKFLEKVREFQINQKILVDCTASEKIAKMYPEFVAAGCDIVTPNKKANVLPMQTYSALRRALAEHRKAFHYQANVGAGLPIIETVKNLVAAGDEIKKIEGIFSGTLSYLFNNYNGKRKFSDLVMEAKEKGYTEPDPKEDLSGQDVGRKLLILARELGWPLEMKDVQLENLADYGDDYFAKRFQKARGKKSVLRYVGTIQKGKVFAKLKDIPADNPLAHTRGTDNIVVCYTKNYSQTPLVIKGPGAGVEVTASAVLVGIIKTINNLWKIKN